MFRNIWTLAKRKRALIKDINYYRRECKEWHKILEDLKTETDRRRKIVTSLNKTIINQIETLVKVKEASN